MSAPTSEKPDWDRVGRWVLTLLVGAAIVVLVVHGMQEGVDRPAVVARVREAGAWGVVGYLVAFWLLQPFGVSGHVFALAAALLWPPWLAFLLAWAGTIGTSVVSFAFARYLAFDWVQARLPERVRRYEQWMIERGLWGVFLVRLLTFTMHPVQFMMGVVRVPFGTMLLGTALGFAPTVGLDVFLGGRVLEPVLDWLAA